MTGYCNLENRIYKILIIDDNPHNLRVMSDFLDDRQFTVYAAEDGESGFERARYVLPDVILMDALMPGIDGFETCRRLKIEASTREIPVIFMTALSETEHKVKAFQAGAVDYITKPFQKEEVLARLRVHLRLRELTASLSEANRTLETRVAERTEQLARTNRELAQQHIENQKIVEALQTSERKLKAIFDQSYQFISYLSLSGKVLQANQSALSFAGLALSDVYDKYFWETAWWQHAPDLQETMRSAIARAAQGETIRFDASHLSAEGERYHFDFSLKPVRDETGKVFLLIAEGRDMTDLQTASQALTEARNYLDQIINAMADPLFVKDRQHRMVLVNDALCDFLGVGREQLLGTSDYDFFPKHEADIFREKDEVVFASGMVNLNEETITNADGVVRTILTKKTRYIDKQGRAFIVGNIRDVSEHKAMEAQLRQAVKMEAIGTLAGGVAHDFNNLMTAVIGYSSLLQQKLDPDSPLRKDVEQIKKAGERAAKLTQQLLAFSRKQVVQPQVVDLNAVLADLNKMLVRLIGEDIDLVSLLKPDLWRVVSDPSLIEQVIMNLAINARDAMPRGGKLTLETANVLLDDSYTKQHIGVVPGPHVLLAVSDNGTGMDAQTLSHIFEPFFTTKAKGKGTGLGLATVYGIVKQSGGHIWVYSEVGQGTTFKIYLPRAETDLESTLADDDDAPVVQGGTETILVVEDDDTLRALVKQILQLYGYRVLEASGGAEAFTQLNQYSGTVELLITDVVMPEMGGRQVAEAITATHPALRVLYISGYTDDAIVHHGVLDAGLAFLQKPFSPIALAQKVRQMLDDKATH